MRPPAATCAVIATSGTHCAWIEKILKNSDAPNTVETLTHIEIRQILHLEAAAAGNTVGGRSSPGLRNHRRTQVHAHNFGAPRRQQPAPAAHAAPYVQYASSRGDVQPWFERQPLLQMDRPIVEFGHAVCAYRRQPVAFAGESA